MGLDQSEIVDFLPQEFMLIRPTPAARIWSKEVYIPALTIEGGVAQISMIFADFITHVIIL